MTLLRGSSPRAVNVPAALAVGILFGCGSAVVGSGATSGQVAVQVRPQAPRVEAGGAVDFEAAVSGTLDTGVIWSVREAAGGSVDATGLYTAPLSSGTYQVVATSRANPLAEGVATVTVTAPPAQAHAISGSITPAGSGAGATVTLGGAASATTTVDASGGYGFTGLANGDYVVTPTKAGSTFTPASRSVTVNGADVNGLAFTISTFSANLTVDGARTFQTIDGLGTNINVESWKGGELMPALDYLVDVNGASLLRVARDPMDWVSSEADIPALRARDAATLSRIYETAPMKDLWSTIGYLNQKGLGGSQILLNFMGWTPRWIGGSGQAGVPSHITAGKEPALATMIASLIYYGRVVRGLDFTLVSPLNEANLNGMEGPLVGDAQYTTILAALIGELDAMGQTQVRIVGPDTFNDVSYATRMMRDATVAARTDHLAFHTYSGPTSPGPSHPGKNYWLTETAVWCNTCDLNGAPEGGEWAFARDNGMLLLQDVANGFPGILVWEGYDSYWYHHDAYSTWGLLDYDRATGVYTPRKRFYVNSQLTRFIRPGMVRTSLSSAIGGLTAQAFHDAARGKVAIVGRNAGGASVTINGQLIGMPAAVTSLGVFLTDSGSRNLQRGADVPVSGNTFSVTIPADTFFSLAN